MAKKIGQFRYYGENDSRNYPASINSVNLQSGNIFSQYIPIVQLGIQTIPGVEFTLNDATSPMVVGMTGIYELNVDGLSRISSIRFKTESLNVVRQNPNAYLIIDFLYEKEE